MSVLSDVIRSGIRPEDLPDLPEQLQRGLEPLLRYVNTGIQGIAAALGGNVSLTDNAKSEVKTVNLDHGVAQLVFLKKLPQAKGVRSISVGSADGKTQHMLSRPLQLIGTTTPNQVKVLAYFADSTAVRVPVTFELTPEGNYTALTPSDGAWTALPYAANWSDYGGGNMAAGYLKDASGRVHLRGLTKYALGGGGTITIGTLPAGYRPTAFVAFSVANWNGATFVSGTIHIDSAGVVTTATWTNGGAGTSGMNLDGVSFDTRT